MCIPHLVYPLIHQWTLGLLPPFAVVINAAVSMGVPVSLPIPAFSLLGIYPDVELMDHVLILCLPF